MTNNIFSADCKTEKELLISAGAPISNVAKRISADADESIIEKGNAFAWEITDRFVSDFEKEGDKMAHVSTFKVIGDTVYMTYYANTKEPSEDPKNQTARLAYAPIDDMSKMVCLDIQTTGDVVEDRVVDMVYDTILMQKDENTLYVLWTARVDENYYRFYCPFDVNTKTLGEIGDKVDASDKASVQTALDDLKATIPGGNTEDIKAKTEALEKAFYALSEKLYAQQGANGAAGAGDAGNAGGDDTYYNAEYEDKTNE